MEDSDFYEYENRRYVNPMTSRDEQLGFVQTLRDTMGKNTSQINAQTKALGTNVPSNLGGLTGSNSYFAQRYQTTPVESQVNTLKATAQAKALNDLMSNYEAQWKNKAYQAYRNAARRAASGGGGGNSDGGYGGEDVLDNLRALGSGEVLLDDSDNVTYYWDVDGRYWYAKDNATGLVRGTNDPNWSSDSEGIYRNVGSNNSDLTSAAQIQMLSLPFMSNVLNAVGNRNYSSTQWKKIIQANANLRAAERAKSKQGGW